VFGADAEIGLKLSIFNREEEMRYEKLADALHGLLLGLLLIAQNSPSTESNPVFMSFVNWLF